jgi:DNA-binding response OmpR family regulator
MPSVLIAEDDLLIADMLEENLIAAGYTVCGIARTVDGAISLGLLYQPDLAVLDIRLADGGLGTDVAAKLNRQTTGILYASGNPWLLALTRDNGEGCLSKPYGAREVVTSLKIVTDIKETGKTTLTPPRGFQMLEEKQKTSAVA